MGGLRSVDATGLLNRRFISVVLRAQGKQSAHQTNFGVIQIWFGQHTSCDQLLHYSPFLVS